MVFKEKLFSGFSARKIFYTEFSMLVCEISKNQPQVFPAKLDLSLTVNKSKSLSRITKPLKTRKLIPYQRMLEPLDTSKVKTSNLDRKKGKQLQAVLGKKGEHFWKNNVACYLDSTGFVQKKQIQKIR